MDYSPPQYSPRSNYSEESPNIDTSMTDYQQQMELHYNHTNNNHNNSGVGSIKEKSSRFGWIGNLLSRKKSNSSNSLINNSSNSNSINNQMSMMMNNDTTTLCSSSSNNSSNNNSLQNSPNIINGYSNQPNYSPQINNNTSAQTTANNSTTSSQNTSTNTNPNNSTNNNQNGISTSTKRRSIFSFFSVFQYGGRNNNGSASDSSSSSPSGKTSISPLKRFKFTRTSSSTSIDTKSVNKKHMLQTSHSCSTLNINYISTKHELNQLYDPSSLIPTTPTTPPSLLSGSSSLLPVPQSPSYCDSLHPTNNSLPPIPTVPTLDREDSTSSMASSNIDEELSESAGVGKYAIFIPTPIPSPVPHLQDVPPKFMKQNHHHHQQHRQQSNQMDQLLPSMEQQQSMTCRISSQCEESILNRTISSIDIMDITQQPSIPSTPLLTTPTQAPQPTPPIINLPSSDSLDTHINSHNQLTNNQQKNNDDNNQSIGTRDVVPGGIGEHKTVWHSPAKIKSQLQTRTSAPQLGVNSSPMLQTSYSNPKIGTHHWWGSNNPIPNEQNKQDLQMQFLKHQQEQALRTMSDNHLLASSSSNNNNNGGSNLVRATSISKWVSAAPSSPPPMSISAPRGSNTPDESSPERCMSPISSMIRVYYVPLVDEDNNTTNSSNNNNCTNNNIDHIIETAELKNSNPGLATAHPSLYWSHIVVQNTTVKEVVDHVSSKVEKSPSQFKLCCSLNPYDFLDDSVLLIGFRLRKFYLIEVAEEVIVHDHIECNVFANMFPVHAHYFNNNNTSTATISSSMLGSNTRTDSTITTTTTTSSSLSTSCAALANPLSSSWSPSYCKFLSTSSKSLKRTQLLMSLEDSSPADCSPVSSLEDNDDFLLDLPSSPCSYQANPLFSLTGSGSRQHKQTSNHKYHHHHQHHQHHNSNNSHGNNKYLNGGGGGSGSSGQQRSASLVEQPFTISMALKEKIKILDNYFNHYYRELENYLIQRSKRMETLKQVLLESGIRESSIAWGRCVKEHLNKETTYLRSKRARIGPSDFQKLTAIGKGGFGKVYLARKKDSNEIVTLKVIRKNSYHRANQMTSVSKEKAVMMIPHTHREETQWITRLLYSFHDAQYLYLAMEYHCGGDFRALLNNLTRLEDEVASFYMAEMVLAIQSLHKLGYIHRDIKPSNFVVDKNGHLKLIDFGLSKEGFISRNSKYQNTWRTLLNNKENDNSHHLTSIVARSKDKKREQKNEYKVTYSKVGSPEYMAPEMLTGKGYDMTYDYWSLGVVLFEMLFGETPFGGDTPEEVFKNIMDWKTILDWNYLSEFISSNALDLLKLLLCDPEQRLTGDDLKKHPYFEGLDWDNVHKLVPPFVPQVQNELDTSYFEGAEEIESDGDNDYDEVVEAAQEAAEGGENQPDQSPPLHDEDTSFRSMPFGGFNFQRFPSVVEGARVKGLIKSFYVENEKCVSRATSTSSLNSPNTSCANSPIIQSQNSKTQSFNTYHPTSQSYTPSQTTPPTPTSPTVNGYQPKTPILRVSSKSVNNSPSPLQSSNLSKK